MNRQLVLLRWLGWIVVVGIMSGMLILMALIATAAHDIPRVPDRLNRLIDLPPTLVYASDGSLLTRIGGREVIPFDRISPNFLKAVLAAEDDQFYRHPGIDKPALLRAIYGVLIGKRSRGGSTITQQLAKNLFFSIDKSISRKFREMLAALEIERRFSKDEILAAYCNWNSYGGSAYGVEEAATHFFGTHASELSLAQAALLAGLPNSPSRYNPYRHPDRAYARQRWILQRMERLGYITPEERTAAEQDSLHFKPLYAAADEGSYFLDAVMSELEERYGETVVYHGGLKIYTTLDPLLQGYAIEAVRKTLKELDKRFKLEPFSGAEPDQRTEYPQAAMVAVENSTGAVLALIGGRDWYASQFNRATTRNRNMGSSLKPALYLTAIEQLDYTPATVVLDSPLVVEIPGAPDWKPRNFENSYFGSIILKGALERSLNTVAARTILATGPEAMINTLRRLGVKAPLQPHYSLALGGASLSALEMGGFIASIADEGAVIQPYLIKRVEDARGNPLEEHIITFDRQFTPEKVYLLIDMLKGVIEEGTGRNVRRYGFNRPAIGKTGTSNDYRDSWFIGATPRFAASVWVGFDDNRPMRLPGGGRITGATGALPIWARFMNNATEGEPIRDFSIPPGIEFRKVDLFDGSEADSLDENAVRVALPVGTVLPEPVPEPPTAPWDSSGVAPTVFEPPTGEAD